MQLGLCEANIESRSQGATASSALANALSLAQLLAKPGALSALGFFGLMALPSLSEILTNAAAQQQASAVQTTGVHRSGRAGGYEPKVRTKKSFLFFVFFCLVCFHVSDEPSAATDPVNNQERATDGKF